MSSFFIDADIRDVPVVKTNHITTGSHPSYPQAVEYT